MSDLRDVMARAMQAQGQVDPDEVFALVETIDADDGPDRHEPPPIDEGQASLLEYEADFAVEWEAPDQQMNLADGRAARDQAMARVDAAADPDWKVDARRVLDELIEAGEPFTTDEIWMRLGGRRPKEPRALGPLLRSAIESGRIVRAGERQSKIAKRHARPLAVWRPT